MNQLALAQRVQPTRFFVNPRRIAAIAAFDSKHHKDLTRLGIDLTNLVATYDALQADVTTPSMVTPIQFLQNWLPGFVHVITAARKIDSLVGISTIGSWEDVEVVQGLLELLGTGTVYGDYTNVPLGSWNVNYQKRSVVNFEEGMEVGVREQKIAARGGVDSGSEKRKNAALQLEILRNQVGFYGYNGGNNNTYGFLNDPGLTAYFSATTGASSSTQWATKTFLEITADIRLMASNLRSQSQDQIDPRTAKITLALATDVITYLTVTSNFGISVEDWIHQNFKNIRIESAPQLNDANGGANVGYMYAESIDDGSTDDGRTFIQIVPAKFMVVGVAQLIKTYQEDYSNATAGVMCKRPWANVRITGI